MASSFVTSGEDKLEFKNVVLNHIKEILAQSLTITQGNQEKINSYVDSVCGLADILLPFYDKKMTEAYTKFEEAKEKLIKDTSDDFVIKNEAKYFSSIKSIHRKLFRQLNLLMKRQSYLASGVDAEGSEDKEDKEDKEGEEKDKRDEIEEADKGVVDLK